MNDDQADNRDADETSSVIGALGRQLVASATEVLTEDPSDTLATKIRRAARSTLQKDKKAPRQRVAAQRMAKTTLRTLSGEPETEEESHREIIGKINMGYTELVVFSDGTRRLSRPSADGETWLNRPANERAGEQGFQLGGGLSGLLLPYGLTLITGGPGAGKTPFMRDTLQPACEGFDVKRIAFGEPGLEGTNKSADVLGDIYDALNGDRKIILLDSMKNVLFRMGGSLSGKGVNNPFFTILSDWSHEANKARCSIVVIVNPMHPSLEVLEDILFKGGTNVCMLIHAKGGGQFNYVIRDELNAERPKGVIYSSATSISVNSGSSGPKTSSFQQLSPSLDIDITDAGFMNRIIARATRSETNE